LRALTRVVKLDRHLRQVWRLQVTMTGARIPLLDPAEFGPDHSRCLWAGARFCSLPDLSATAPSTLVDEKPAGMIAVWGMFPAGDTE
jgi:hypothetical protein